MNFVIGCKTVSTLVHYSTWMCLTYTTDFTLIMSVILCRQLLLGINYIVDPWLSQRTTNVLDPLNLSFFIEISLLIFAKFDLYIDFTLKNHWIITTELGDSEWKLQSQLICNVDFWIGLIYRLHQLEYNQLIWLYDIWD